VVDHVSGKEINMELSLERNMKCGIGLCDSCSVDGFQICKDGPTFDLRDVRNMQEFGKTKLTESGKRVWF
ncbi:dihydroorotate dehydrogenase electron transfer subunit, partial [mine drainage metagenome]